MEEMRAIVNFHRPRIDALLGTEAVDLLAFETIGSLVEAAAIAELMREYQVGGREWMGGGRGEWIGGGVGKELL
jgi:S-methylmethionine-dependent homocysteine/selenocysteine methylase